MGSSSSKPAQEHSGERIIYAPDPKTSGSEPSSRVKYPSRPQQEVAIEREKPDDYLKILEPKKGPKRMEFHPELPKTLSPKGYTKLKLMMSLANKQYDSLVKRLKRDNKLWEDPEFPADDSSIGVPELRNRLEWKRPKEINPTAEFMVEGASRFDIEQGQIGDCWLLAVVSSISSYPALFNQVVIPGQKMNGPDYVGVFRLRFWRFGSWVEVLVDDRLPVNRGTNNLVFMHSSEQNEFWSALLEKAYAKLCGNYGHLSGGTQCEAMEDMTGGVCETLDLSPRKRPENLLEQMVLYADRCCLMGCSISSNVVEGRLPSGLISGHAYSVTGVKSVNYRNRKQYLVRCRNPWGDHHEWKGAWGDKSSEWREIDPREKKELDLNFRDDGEFWMSYDDFVTNFTTLEVCHLGLESLEQDQDFRGKRRLEESIFAGEWQKNINAGGCINNRTTYWTNPQYRITVKDPDPDDNEDMCTIIIGLMQKDIRKQSGANYQAIGFMLYKADDNSDELMTKAQLMTRSPCDKSSFINTREVVKHFRLKPGSYIIVPSTFQPNIEMKFILRVVAQVKIEDKQLDVIDAAEDFPDFLVERVEEQDMILNEDEAIEQRFDEICDKQTKSINALQLQELLNGSSLQDIEGFSGFNKEVCRSMLASVDHNLTGSMEKAEFMDLWQKAKTYKVCFALYDVSRTGSFSAEEFREALRAAGYSVSNKLFNALVKRYEDPDTEAMKFEDFMLCCVRLRNVFETSTAQPKTYEGAPMFRTDDFLRFSVYI